ncbi:phage integrase SAM-like domain-containing protein [Alistipes communis]|uniref:phage integrase SAM-like domain-containing protein n=1 Tax=Alistipes communis TaxID=2585118 RepID=UPI003AF99093
MGVDRSESTWWCYRAVLGHLRAFLKHEYNLHHIPLLELEQSFIEQYHVYLKTVCRSKAGSVCRYIDCLNNVVRISFTTVLCRGIRSHFAAIPLRRNREPFSARRNCGFFRRRD